MFHKLKMVLINIICELYTVIVLESGYIIVILIIFFMSCVHCSCSMEQMLH